MTLASNSDPLFRPGIRQTSAYSSSPTDTVGADWERLTGDARSLRTQNQAEQIRQGAQVNRNIEDRTLHTCRTVPPGHTRRALNNLPGMLEHK